MFTKKFLSPDPEPGGGEIIGVKPSQLKKGGRPENILDSLEDLNSRIYDSAGSLRHLKNEIVGEAPAEPQPDNNEKQQEPISFMDKLERQISICKKNQVELAKELEEFRQRLQ